MQLVHNFVATLSNTMIHKQFKNDKKGFGKFGPLAEGRGVSTLGPLSLSTLTSRSTGPSCFDRSWCGVIRKGFPGGLVRM